jgi:ribonuclease BN (tRNA processing enzyme)
MELIILGSGTAIPSARRGAPGAVIKIGDELILLDCGPGSLHRLAKAGLNFLNIYYILISHLHPDHIADLVPFLFALRSPDLPLIQKEITIIGGRGVEHFFEKIHSIYGSWAEPPRTITLIETISKEISFPLFLLKTTPAVHLPSSIAFRITTPEGKSLFYSGDTDYSNQLIDLAQGVDLALIECSFPEGNKVEGHLTPKIAGRIAAEASCQRIILTHLYPQCEASDIKKQCAEVYKGEIIIAQDGMRIQV